MRKFIKINDSDNVLVALVDLLKGELVEGIQLQEDIGGGHKLALKDIKSGEDIIKYGSPIGYATKDIVKGELVHSHNTKTKLKGIEEYSFNQKLTQLLEEDRSLTFKGYYRENGKVGIRNELWVVPTVGCVNGTAEMIVKKFKEQVNPSGIDDIVVYNHNYGCSQLGDDHQNTQKILGGIIKHPNAGGVLVLGLGCENNYVAAFKETLGEYNQDRVRFLVAQEVVDEIEIGVQLLKELYHNMKPDERKEAPLSRLKIGLKCGGSDGFSGITANPLLGAFTDLLVSQGGTTVLTEVPEMFGAETLLMDRAQDEKVFEKVVSLVNDFKQYFIEHKQSIYENPSPGNKAGGITTLEEKSLGCTQKGGLATVVDVLKYGEQIELPGLNLLSAPGNDLVAATALGASGCHIVLFTTGRGTPFGSFVPTMKVSSNTQLYKNKPHWIDFNAGTLVEEKTITEVLGEFVSYIIKVASGELVNNEKNGFKEIAIFKTGVTL
ncbi:MAG: altronate dehydratase family protein [Bacillota bacterium]|nr:altronate dehydratase family protein [Bacillota bacterium]